MSKDRAIGLLRKFAARNSPKGKWKYIGRDALANGLLKRINNPDSIAQKDTPLCGPAAFLRTVARHKPYTYANAGIELYEKGKTKIGGLEIKPGSELIGDRPEGKTQVADWIMLASLRDSDNWLFSPSGIFGSSVAGITRPATIASWFTAAGYSKVVNKASLQKHRSDYYYAKLLDEAEQLYDSGYKVLMLIDGDVLDRKTQDDAVSLFPDHWVALYSRIHDRGTTAYDQNIQLWVWTWARARPIPFQASKPLKKKHFLNKFYGFVAAKP